MLILERKSGQSILIGDDIEVRVIHISDRKIKLGITAPDDVSVDREEIRIRKQGYPR